MAPEKALGITLALMIAGMICLIVLCAAIGAAGRSIPLDVPTVTSTAAADGAAGAHVQHAMGIGLTAFAAPEDEPGAFGRLPAGYAPAR